MDHFVDEGALSSEALSSEAQSSDTRLPTEAEVARMRFRFKVSEPSIDTGADRRQRLGRSRLAVVFSHGVGAEWIAQFLTQNGVVGAIERRKQHTYLISLPLNIRKRHWIKEIGSHPRVRYVGRYW